MAPSGIPPAIVSTGRERHVGHALNRPSAWVREHLRKVFLLPAVQWVSRLAKSNPKVSIALGLICSLWRTPRVQAAIGLANLFVYWKLGFIPEAIYKANATLLVQCAVHGRPIGPMEEEIRIERELLKFGREVQEQLLHENALKRRHSSSGLPAQRSLPSRSRSAKLH